MIYLAFFRETNLKHRRGRIYGKTYGTALDGLLRKPLCEGNRGRTEIGGVVSELVCGEGVKSALNLY